MGYAFRQLQCLTDKCFCSSENTFWHRWHLLPFCGIWIDGGRCGQHQEVQCQDRPFGKRKKVGRCGRDLEMCWHVARLHSRQSGEGQVHARLLDQWRSTSLQLCWSWWDLCLELFRDHHWPRRHAITCSKKQRQKKTSSELHTWNMLESLNIFLASFFSRRIDFLMVLILVRFDVASTCIMYHINSILQILNIHIQYIYNIYVIYIYIFDAFSPFVWKELTVTLRWWNMCGTAPTNGFSWMKLVISICQSTMLVIQIQTHRHISSTPGFFVMKNN